MLSSIFLQTENQGGATNTFNKYKNSLCLLPNSDDTSQRVWQSRAALTVRLGSGTCCFSRTGCRLLCSAPGHAHFAQHSLKFFSPFRAQQDPLSQFINSHSQRPQQVRGALPQTPSLLWPSQSQRS